MVSALEDNGPVNLGLSVVDEFGGAQLDVIGTETIYQPASATPTPVETTNAPEDTTVIRITAWGGANALADDTDDEEYVIVKSIVNLTSQTYSGTVASIASSEYANNYAWNLLALGTASSDGLSEGARLKHADPQVAPTIDVNISASTGQNVRIDGNQTEADQIYFIEYLTATGTSSDFIGNVSTVLDPAVNSGSLTFPANTSFATLSLAHGREDSDTLQENKGFATAYLNIDSVTGIAEASGTIFMNTGRGDELNVAYGFTGYDLTSGIAVLASGSGATITGDQNALASELPNPTLVWDADTQTLTITRSTEFAATTTTQVFATAYERINGVSSPAGNLGSSSVSLPFLRAVDDTSVQFDLPIPVGAETGTLTFSATAQSASQANDENMGAATVFVDLVNGLSSGTSSMFRSSRPDLISWDNLPYNVDVLDANTVAGASVTGNLGDDDKNAYLEQHFAVLSFDRVTDANGVDVLRGTFNYTEDGGVTHFDDFVIHGDWFGPQSITVPSPNTLGSYVGTTDPLAQDPITGRYIVPNDEADQLAFEPAANASGIFDATVNQGGFVGQLSIEIKADAETPTLNTISLNTAQNFPSDISNAIQTTIGDSGDTNESISSILITIPEGHTIDDGVNGPVTAGTGGQTIEIASWSFNTLTYESPDLGDFDISVTVTATDEHGFTATDDSSTNDSETATDTFTVTVLLDTDGDGIPDATEGTGDTDGDGTPDNEDTDSDNDGTPDITEGTGDADGDGTPDYLDDDFDNDGITDNLDLDLDNDGIPNTTECSVATGSINEGLGTTEVSGNYSIDGNDVMAFDLTGPYAFDLLGSTERLQFAYNQGTERLANLDLEFAAPTSGLFENVVIGTGAPGVEEGGQIARKDIAVTWSGGGAAVINDPDDEIINYNTDDVVTSGVVLQTRVRNFNTTQWSMTIDLSGVTIFPTSIGFFTDATAHRRNSINFEGLAFSVIIECDTDGDGIPDVNDLDSDGDSISDLIESGVNASLVDPDDDGMYDVGAVDNDGVPTAASGGVTPVDTDGDGIPDTKDSDSDDDGVPDFQDNDGGLAPVLTNDPTPTLSGKTFVAPDETLSITVNGVTYIDGDGNLVANPDDTWALTIPDTATLPDGNYDVAITVTDADGNAITDTAVGALSVDATDPATPSSNIQVTNNTTPTISGTAIVVAGEALTVSVGDNIYTTDDDNLALDSEGIWELTVPEGSELPDGDYEVVATVTDEAGNVATSTSTLTVDTIDPATPSITTRYGTTDTPTISIDATVVTGETLTVTINNFTYSQNDDDLAQNSEGIWELTIPEGSELLDGDYQVTATVTDEAGNVSTSTSTLTVDTVLPATPSITTRYSNTDILIISGNATVVTGETLTVTFNEVTYTQGDGNLVLNENGSWALTVPNTNDGDYEVVATVTDEAGNVATSTSTLTVDTIDPATPSITTRYGTTDTPTISFDATVITGETFTVTVNNFTYSQDDDDLAQNSEGIWELTIPEGSELPDGDYEVIATVTDAPVPATSTGNTINPAIPTRNL